MQTAPNPDLILTVRQEAARLLKESRVKVVIGFESGTQPLRARPIFITNPNEIDKLTLSGMAQNNLAVYLTRRPKGEKIAIICRGCESRAIRALIIEHQYNRELLYLIGVPCSGILDWRKIEAEVGEKVISAVEEAGKVVVSTPQGEYHFQRSQLLHESCAYCRHPNPVGVDILFGEPSPERNDDQSAQRLVREFEAKSALERLAYFIKESGRCIRCYACRQACPMCYCTQCFVDQSAPRWIESMITPAGLQAWQIIRAFHQTGRCVSCGACERACPMDIKMIYLTEKLNDDMRKLYGFEAGLSEGQPPLAAFSLDDKELFPHSMTKMRREKCTDG